MLLSDRASSGAVGIWLGAGACLLLGFAAGLGFGDRSPERTTAQLRAPPTDSEGKADDAASPPPAKSRGSQVTSTRAAASTRENHDRVRGGALPTLADVASAGASNPSSSGNDGDSQPDGIEFDSPDKDLRILRKGLHTRTRRTHAPRH